MHKVRAAAKTTPLRERAAGIAAPSQWARPKVITAAMAANKPNPRSPRRRGKQAAARPGG